MTSSLPLRQATATYLIKIKSPGGAMTSQTAKLQRSDAQELVGLDSFCKYLAVWNREFQRGGRRCEIGQQEHFL